MGRLIQLSDEMPSEGEAFFNEIAHSLLQGKRHLFDKLTAAERTLVVRWLSDALVDPEGRSPLADVLWEIDYVRPPVSIEEFLHDDYYMGRTGSDLHPKWKEDLYEVFKPGSTIFEWVMTGAIGIGKTTLAGIALVRKIYELSCLRDPSAYYGLLPESLVVFGIYSITKRQVSDSGYYKVRGYLDGSPYFRQEFPRSTKIDSKIDFERSAGKKVQVIPGSQELHALGLDLFAFMMDEVNFMRVKDNKEAGVQTGQAYDLYNATFTRLQSRFIRPGGTIPGLMLLLSSRNAQTSFLEQHLAKQRSSHYTHVSDYPLWDVKPASRFTMPRFRVEVGDRVSQSRVLRPGDDTRPGARIVEIPGEFRAPFDEDVDQALRDIAGVATFNLSPLIRDRKSVTDCVEESIEHPFTREVATITIEDDVRLEDYFRIASVAKTVRSQWRPLLNPTHPRYIHVDIGLTGDALGIAMGHVAGTVKLERELPDGSVSPLNHPFIAIDLMLRVETTPGGEVDLAKVRSFIQYLARLFAIRKVTFDGFQSADSIQILKKAGMEVGKLSVDRNDEAYLSLRSAMFDRRMAYANYKPFLDEVLDLERDSKAGKVDHPTKATTGGKGRKDVADAVAGVTWLCINDPHAMEVASAVHLDVRESVPKPEPLAVAPAVAAQRPSAGGKVAGLEWEDLRRNVGR